MKKYAPYITIFLVVIGFCFFSVAEAHAADNSGILNDIAKLFREESQKWVDIVLGYAKWLFWTLAGISMIFSFGYMAVEGLELGKLYATILRFIITIGLFWWLLENGAEIAEAIINSLVKIAGNASSSGVTSASGIMDLGFSLFDKLSLASDNMSWTTGLIAVIVAVLVLIILSLIAANVTIEWCATYILIYAGVIVLGLGSLTFSRDYAIQYFKSVIAQGLRLMSMLFLAALAATIIQRLGGNASGAASLKDCVVVLVGSLIIYVLMQKIPSMFGALVGAAPSVSTVGIGTALAVAGAAVGAGMMLAGNAIGAKQLISAIRDGANSGGGSGGSGSGSISGAGGDSGGSGKGGSGFGDAMGAKPGLLSALASAAADSMSKKSALGKVANVVKQHNQKNN